METESANALSSYRTFDEYVADYPDGEPFRTWVGKPGTVLLKSKTGCGLPGGYYWARVVWEKLDQIRNISPKVWVNDEDDGFCERFFETEGLAEFELVILMTYAPVDLADLSTMGYTS